MSINDLQVAPESQLPSRESYVKWLEDTRANDAETMEQQVSIGKKEITFYEPKEPAKQKKPQKKRDPYVFSVKLQKEFCVHLAILGRFTHSARAVGVSFGTVKIHQKNNPDFAEMVAEAQQEYRDRIAAEVYKRAVEGWEVPIIGGQWKDEIVAYEHKFSDRLLEMEAKRVDSGYREKQTLNVGQQGGVIVINASPQDAGAWRDKYNGAQIVEVEPLKEAPQVEGKG